MELKLSQGHIVSVLGNTLISHFRWTFQIEADSGKFFIINCFLSSFIYHFLGSYFKSTQVVIIFWSGTNCIFHLRHTSFFKVGRRIGLLRMLGTRCVAWYWTLPCLLKQKKAMTVTTKTPILQQLSLVDQGIENPIFHRTILAYWGFASCD